ncbi:hypothetical protein [Butyrivibrio sp. XPD2002]|uniref:hypothetical protein n=1 Tax=Butyrivibrio sp. XPD2002 TaxID=1280665 RepID=UPI00041A0F49|nr:hypothetical protein [Butyrivibrio sp. XPD2002]
MTEKSFVNWLAERNLEEEFDEALKCYRIQAYKAAYLFSYVTFLKNIANQMIKYKGVPTACIAQTKGNVTGATKVWNRIVNDVNNPVTWEESVRNEITRKDNNIFNVPDDIRNELDQHRNKRNVCAHGKSRPIDESSVEDLWNFITYAMNYLVIDGTVEQWKNDMEDMFHYSLSDVKDKFENKMYVYATFVEDDKKDIFNWMLDQSMNAEFNTGNYVAEITCYFFERVLERTDALERKFVDGDHKKQSFLSIITDVYKLTEIPTKYVYAGRPNQVASELSAWKHGKKNIQRFFKYIFIKSKANEYWDILSQYCREETCEFDRDILNNLALCISEKLDELKVLYVYSMYASNKEYLTGTIDYNKVYRYIGDIKLILMIFCNEVSVADDVFGKLNEFVLRCLIEYKTGNGNFNNYKVWLDDIKCIKESFSELEVNDIVFTVSDSEFDFTDIIRCLEDENEIGKCNQFYSIIRDDSYYRFGISDGTIRMKTLADEDCCNSMVEYISGIMNDIDPGFDVSINNEIVYTKDAQQENVSA